MIEELLSDPGLMLTIAASAISALAVLWIALRSRARDERDRAAMRDAAERAAREAEERRVKL